MITRLTGKCRSSFSITDLNREGPTSKYPDLPHPLTPLTHLRSQEREREREAKKQKERKHIIPREYVTTSKLPFGL